MVTKLPLVYRIITLISKEVVLVFSSDFQLQNILTDLSLLLNTLIQISNVYEDGVITEVISNDDYSEIKIYFKHNTNYMKDGIEVLKRIEGYDI